jgi:NAD(P)-dependent dehydrogenase (short-subunit alcohol dehydrogenase family)
MEYRHIWKDIIEPLELHADTRGRIADIFYGGNINHVAIIESSPNAIRGNHYHKETTQHILMLSGGLEYWYKDVNSSEPAKCRVVKQFELISTSPNEIHALRILPVGNVFIVFSEGKRGGKDYESDTYRVPSIIGTSPYANLSDLNGKKIVLFGGTGGIGESTCQIALENTSQCFKYGSKDLDFSSDNVQQALPEFLKDADIVINCAGILGKDDTDYRNIFDINFKSSWDIIQFYLKNPPSKKVNLCFVGSSAYNRSSPKYMLYAASKASLVSIVRSAAPVLKEKNVFLNLVNPSKTNTKMRREIFPSENIDDLLQPNDVANSILTLSLTEETGEIIDL